MQAPNVKIKQWTRVGQNDALVLRINSAESIYVGYQQNGLKAIGEEVVWVDASWQLKHEGPNGANLRAPEEAAVKRGPRI